jgi:predicted nucleic acid-binding protein
MQQFVHSVTVLPFDEPVIWETIQLRQQQKVKKLPDAIVAATAVAYNLILITRNTNDFKDVPGLTLLNLHNEQELVALGINDLEGL